MNISKFLSNPRHLSKMCRSAVDRTLGDKVIEYEAIAYRYELIPVNPDGTPAADDSIEVSRLKHLMADKFSAPTPQAEVDGLRRAGFFVPSVLKYPANMARRMKRAMQNAEQEWKRNGGRVLPIRMGIDGKPDVNGRFVADAVFIPKELYLAQVWASLNKNLAKLA